MNTLSIKLVKVQVWENEKNDYVYNVHFTLNFLKLLYEPFWPIDIEGIIVMVKISHSFFKPSFMYFTFQKDCRDKANFQDYVRLIEKARWYFTISLS